jgi:hypothetical protein
MLQLLLYAEELNSHCQALAKQLRQPKQAELIQKRNRYASASITFLLLRCSCKTKGITCYCSSSLGWGDISIARTLYKNFFLLPQASFSILKIIDKNRFEVVLVICFRLNCYNTINHESLWWCDKPCSFSIQDLILVIDKIRGMNIFFNFAVFLR